MDDQSTPTHSPSFDLQVLDGRIYEIRSHGKFSLELTESIIRYTDTYLAQHGTPEGLILDVRAHEEISMVRLNRLLDILCRLNVPVAVVFRDVQQQQFALLLHRTLVHQEQVAYFTELEDARHFTRTGTLPDDSQPPA